MKLNKSKNKEACLMKRLNLKMSVIGDSSASIIKKSWLRVPRCFRFVFIILGVWGPILLLSLVKLLENFPIAIATIGGMYGITDASTELDIVLWEQSSLLTTLLTFAFVFNLIRMSCRFCLKIVNME